MATTMPTREQMIADLAAPSRAQMIADLKGQQAASAPEPTAQDNVASAAQTLQNSTIPAQAGISPTGAQEATQTLPGMGAAVGSLAGPVGAGIGGGAGSLTKDVVNNWLYGGNKPYKDIAIDAGEEAAKDSALTWAIPKVLEKAGDIGKSIMSSNLGSKVGALVSDVSAPVIKAYADGAERIKAAFASGGESTFRMAQAARQQYVQDIVGTRATLNQAISEGIKGSSAEISAEPIVKNLEDAAARLSPKLDGDQIAEIRSMIAKVKDVADEETGKISIQEAQKLKVHLQGIADGAYAREGESVAATEAEKAAKGAAATVRKSMDPHLPEAVTKANQKLSTLHTIEDNMNKALLNPRKSAAALISAGTGESAAGAKNLADLQDMQAITGSNMIQPAQDIAAAQKLGSYKFSPHIRGLGQPAVKGLVDASQALSSGQGNTLGTVLGQSVMHGSGAEDSLRTVGGGQ